MIKTIKTNINITEKKLNTLLQEVSIQDHNPTEGVSKFPVHVYDFANVPGASLHWDEEMKSRKKQIEEVQNQSLTERAFKVLKKNKISPKMTGEEIMSAKDSLKAKEYIQKLKQNPADGNSRLDFVGLALTKSLADTKDIFTYNPESCRKLYLQGNIACYLGEISLRSLGVIFKTQKLYVEKTMARCRHEIKKIDSSLAQGEFAPKVERQLKKRAQSIKQTMALLQSFQEYTNRFSNQKNSDKILKQENQAISLNELKEYILNTSKTSKSNEKVQQQLIERVASILNPIRYFPLLIPIAHEIADWTIKIEKSHPLPYFLKARLYMSELVYAKNRAEIGEKSPVFLKFIQKKFNSGYHHYALAAKRVGKLPKTQTDFTILIEFAQIVYFFYNLANNLLQINLPHPWLKNVVDKALEVTELAYESGKIGNLQKVLLRIQAGL